VSALLLALSLNIFTVLFGNVLFSSWGSHATACTFWTATSVLDVICILQALPQSGSSNHFSTHSDMSFSHLFAYPSTNFLAASRRASSFAFSAATSTTLETVTLPFRNFENVMSTSQRFLLLQAAFTVTSIGMSF